MGAETFIVVHPVKAGGRKILPDPEREVAFGPKEAEDLLAQGAIRRKGDTNTPRQREEGGNGPAATGEGNSPDGSAGAGAGAEGGGNGAVPAPELEGVAPDLVAAILALDPEDKAHFTAANAPSATVLSEKLERQVTAAERDDAWAKLQAHRAEAEQADEGETQD